MLRRSPHFPLPAALALAALLLGASATPADAGGPRLVRVTIDTAHPLAKLLEAGADVIDVHGGWADVLEWPGDQATLAALGAAVRVLDERPGLTAATRARAQLAARPAAPAERVRSATRPDGAFRTELLPPAGSGSLAGFWTLAEVKTKLDQLVANDAQNLVAGTIDTLGRSLQNRPVWGLKLGLGAGIATDVRPVVLFNALTHAREPEGMQVLFGFVDDLLARYPADPVAKYLLEHRWIYVVPVVNPDGYAMNQRIYDSTAAVGYWRKNLRDTNGDHVSFDGDGVDLNRNFGFQWGLDNVGSSGVASQETYRGASAFSEPETRIQRDLVIALQPTTGFSFHTFSDLMLHAWGWTPQGTPDSLRFQEWSDELTLRNGFTSGPSPRVLYAVNGEFNDWIYGDTVSKPRGWTWTPEVGDPLDDFWPAPARIAPLTASLLPACWTVAGLAGPWVHAERTAILEGALNAGGAAHLAVRARNIGMTGTAGPGLAATLTALDPATAVLSGPLAYPSLGSMQSADATGGASFWVAAADTVTPGRMVNFLVEFTDPAGVHCRDTLGVIVGTPTVLRADACESLAGWSPVSGLWGVVASDAAHPDRYLSDSPLGNYPDNYDASVTLSPALDLSAGVHAWAFFEDRWQFESDYDAAELLASTDGVAWTPVRTGGTTASSAADILGGGRPAFEGSRWRWRADRADLSAFAGGAATHAVRLRFHSASDPGTHLDGFSLDSLVVAVYDPAAQPAPTAVGPAAAPGAFALLPPSPNPARGPVRLEFDAPRGGRFEISVHDVQGRAVYQRVQALPAGASAAGATHFQWGWDLRDDAGRRVAPGLYFVAAHLGADRAVRRLVVLP